MFEINFNDYYNLINVINDDNIFISFGNRKILRNNFNCNYTFCNTNNILRKQSTIINYILICIFNNNYIKYYEYEIKIFNNELMLKRYFNNFEICIFYKLFNNNEELYYNKKELFYNDKDLFKFLRKHIKINIINFDSFKCFDINFNFKF